MKKIIIFTIISLVFVTFGCKKDKSLDAGTCSISDEKVEAIYNSATINGAFTSSFTVETMAVVYSQTSDMKSASSAPCTMNGKQFSVEITDLSADTKYYYCFEFSNKYSSKRSDVKSFQTLAATIPTVVTGSISEITQTSAVCGGEVTNDGGVEVTVRGVCWSTSQNPILSDAHNASGSGTGSYIVNMPALTANTTYYVRAYAKNSVGLAFGEVKQFKTNEIIVKPTVTTIEIKNITALSAVAVGNVTADGGAEITSRGFCWSKSENPTIEDSHIEVEGTTGVLEGSLLNLEANKSYHVRAFATNSAGTSYGEKLTFTTNEGLPVVVTSSVTEITATTAKCGGNVTDQGASNVTERGICWSTNHNPTIVDSHVSGGSGTGTYTCSMTGLTPNATYYVRAYAKNTQGISYGSEVNFVALEGLPTVTTSAVMNIASTTATGGGNVTNQGASSVTERGVCWGSEHNPTMEGNHASSGSGAGTFTAQITNLIAGTKYYVRAYAKNSQGTSYGTEVEFTTSATLPTVTTGSVTDITQTTATGSGNVTNTGGATVTERGICWSTTANPTADGNHAASGSGTGSFTANITGLTAGTTYHVRAYAKNSAGTAYGSDVTFTTTATLPTVTTAQVSNITQTTAQGGGNVTSDGGATVTDRGVCWSTNANPTTADSHVASGTGTGGFTANMTDLTANTTYHVRAYATNSQGTSYGSEVTFTTSQSISAPTVTTAAVTNISQTTATGGGNVTADGGATVTERGICWGTSQNPTTSGTHSNSGTGTGEFTVHISGLMANTTYYVRAYAVNEAGEGYGEEVSFTTIVDLPTVTTSEITNITQTTATGGGNVTSGINVTEKGVCWSTSQNPTTNDSHTSDGAGTGSFTSSITGLSANTTYYVRAYATNNAGTSYGEEVNFTTCGGGSIGGHEYVDLGLPSGLLWATCNIGANNPEDYGDYFAWGETTTKNNYSWETYQWCNGSNTTMTKYCTQSNYGYVDNKWVLEMSDDAANANWGSDWSMPTQIVWYELWSNTTSEWTTHGGVNGIRFTSTISGYTNMSLFLPAAGFRSGTSLNDAGSLGAYWSSSLYDISNSAYDLYFSSGVVTPQSGGERDYGFPVRPVYDPTPTVTTSSVSNISTTSATCGGNVTSDGGNTVTARGVCWSTSQNPTIVQSHTTDGSGTGSFTSSITNLSPNTTYYVRAYATNNAGTSYGEEVEFVSTAGSSGSIGGHAYSDLGLPSGLLWATCNVGADTPEDYGEYFTGGVNAAYDWGSPWRMPTLEEQQELINNCVHSMGTQNEIFGCTLQGENGKSIFLPAGGYSYNGCYNDVGTKGWYWSSSRNNGLTDYYFYLIFDASTINTDAIHKRSCMTVRLVCSPQK